MKIAVEQKLKKCSKRGDKKQRKKSEKCICKPNRDNRRIRIYSRPSTSPHSSCSCSSLAHNIHTSRISAPVRCHRCNILAARNLFYVIFKAIFMFATHFHFICLHKVLTGLFLHNSAIIYENLWVARIMILISH